MDDLDKAAELLFDKRPDVAGVILVKSSRRVECGPNDFEVLSKNHKISDCYGLIIRDGFNGEEVSELIKEGVEKGFLFVVKAGISTVDIIGEQEYFNIDCDILPDREEIIYSGYKPESYWYDKTLMESKYRMAFKKDANLNQPQDFNEKLLWLILNRYNDKKISDLVDKIKVKNYVVNKTQDQNSVAKTLIVYDSPDDINFDNLPNKWVMKTNHGSHCVFIHKGGEFDENMVREKMRESFNSNYYYSRFGCREKQYRDIKPKIFVEEFIEGMVEYDLLCINGKVKYILAFGTESTAKGGIRLTHQNVYDTNWNYVDAMIGYKNNPNKLDAKPTKLAEMIKFAEELAEGFPILRVDLSIDAVNQIRLGELTFSPYAGLGKIKPESLRLSLGKEIKL